MPITDLSGRSIPGDVHNTVGAPNLPRVTAQAPVFQAPDVASQEYMFVGDLNVPAATAAFTSLNDTINGGAFAPRIDQQYRARLSNIFVTCPDMVAATAVYLTIRVTVNDQAIPGWGTVPLAPRNGIASVSFDSSLIVGPGTKLGLLVQNLDAVNAHYVLMYLYGWQWPV